MFSSLCWTGFRLLPRVGRHSTAASKPHRFQFSVTSFIYSPPKDSHSSVKVAKCLWIMLSSTLPTAASQPALSTVPRAACPDPGDKPKISNVETCDHAVTPASQLVDGKRRRRKNTETEKKGTACRNCIASAPNIKDNSPQHSPGDLFQTQTRRPGHLLHKSFPASVHFSANKPPA